MGVDCSSCGCKDQNEFKLNEVQLDDKAAAASRKNKVYGGVYNTNGQETNMGGTGKATGTRDG